MIDRYHKITKYAHVRKEIFLQTLQLSRIEMSEIRGSQKCVKILLALISEMSKKINKKLGKISSIFLMIWSWRQAGRQQVGGNGKKFDVVNAFDTYLTINKINILWLAKKSCLQTTNLN